MTATAALPPADSSALSSSTAVLASSSISSPPSSPPAGLKICCACPETRTPRDTCVVERGQENCTELIEQHKQCLRALGFKV